MIFSKIFILAETSLKNRRMGITVSFYNFLYILVNIELACTRGPERDFRLLKKNIFFKQWKCEIDLSRTRELRFSDVARVQKYVNKKHRILEYCILLW